MKKQMANIIDTLERHVHGNHIIIPIMENQVDRQMDHDVESTMPRYHAVVSFFQYSFSGVSTSREIFRDSG